jgi:hypothetical protein
MLKEIKRKKKKKILQSTWIAGFPVKIQKEGMTWL